LQIENNNTDNSIQQSIQYEKNNRITNTVMLVLWANAYYGAVDKDHESVGVASIRHSVTYVQE
jgi:hypothetical protein